MAGNKAAQKYADMFFRAMQSIGREDAPKLGKAFYKRYIMHQNSDMYKEYDAKYPSVGVEKVYAAITFAQVMLKLGYSLDDALKIWDTELIANKRKRIRKLIALFDSVGLGYRLVTGFLDSDKKARDKDGSILYDFYKSDGRELEYQIHTCAYVALFEHYGIRKFCKSMCDNDLCMCALQKSGHFIRYSDLVDGNCCHDKLTRRKLTRSGAR